ncbi:SIG15 protein, partial [Atractosteus spatula]|nr:SIG15 protein [Atractosteus spatula]
WSMSIPAQVTGTKGQAVVLPCSFTHPQQDTYTGGIRVIWRVVSLSGQVIFQCHVSNSTEGSSAGCVDPNAPKRFRLQGDPRLRDLSLHIEDLQPSDSSTYYCRVELDADKDKYGDINGTKLQVLAQVTGTKGQAVVLPCSFTHPQQDTYTGGIRIIWRVRSPSGQVIFQCHVSNSTEGSSGCVDPNAPKRFRLQGDPRLRDLSLHIEDLQPSDSSTYYCRVELDADKDKYGDVNGTKLQVLGKLTQGACEALLVPLQIFLHVIMLMTTKEIDVKHFK